MVLREFYETRFDGVNLYRTYSNKGVYIHKVGTNEEYPEAIDVESAPFVYEETDKPIEKTEEDGERINE
jgi:hypothetical protein